MEISKVTNKYIFIFGTMILAMFFRWPSLFSHSLWADEISIWLAIRADNFQSMIDYHIAHDFNPPGYTIIQYFYSKLFSDFVISLRSFAFLGNILALGAACLLAVKLDFSKYSKVLLTILLVLNYQLVFFSHEARAYNWMIFFSLMSAYYYMRFTAEVGLEFNLKKLIKNFNFWLLVFFLTLLSYSHYFGTFAVFCLGINFLFSDKLTKSRFLTFFITFGLSFLFFLPQLYFALKTVTSVHSLWIHTPYLSDFLSYLKYYFGGSSLSYVICLIIIITALAKFQLWKTHSKSVSIFLSLLLGPFILGYLISNIYIPMMYNRYMLIGLVPFLFVFVLAFEKIVTTINLKKRQIFFSVIAFYFILQGTNTLFIKKQFYTKPKNEQLREASEYILNTKGDSPALVLTNRDSIVEEFYFVNSRVSDVKVVDLLDYKFKKEDLNNKLYLMDFQMKEISQLGLPIEFDVEKIEVFNLLQVINLKAK